MDERTALALLADELPAAGDDAAVVDGTVLTTDMLHERTDFPAGTTRYTAGWRAVGASLSDVAAMGARATAAVGVYAAPAFDRDELLAFVRGARDVCEVVDAAYVGGDLDDHDEFTVATTAAGETDDPVYRSGASPGEAVCVTGTLGRSAAALRLFDDDEDDDDDDDDASTTSTDAGGNERDATARTGTIERANELFRFEPRVAAGVAVRPYAGAMMDSSDGLARSLHQLAAASNCGFAIESARLPVDEAVEAVATGPVDRRELAVHVGEDFELVFTAPEDALATLRDETPVRVTRIGTVTEPDPTRTSGARTDADDGDGASEPVVRLDGEPLPDRGYAHGDRQ